MAQLQENYQHVLVVMCVYVQSLGGTTVLGPYRAEHCCDDDQQSHWETVIFTPILDLNILKINFF